MLIRVLKDGLTLGGRVWGLDDVLDTEDGSLTVAIPESVLEAVEAGEHPYLEQVSAQQAKKLSKERKTQEKAAMPPPGVHPLGEEETMGVSDIPAPEPPLIIQRTEVPAVREKPIERVTRTGPEIIEERL